MVSSRFYENIVVTLRRLRCLGWAYDTVIRSTMKTETYIITRLRYPLARLQVDTAQTDQSVNSVPCSHFFFVLSGVRLKFKALTESPGFPVRIELHPKHNSHY